MGLTFRNPVGLAAGMDKNAAHIDALGSFGFGHIEVGTVTPQPQPGNPKPRLFRIVPAQALINRMGFNNDGVERFVANVRRQQRFRAAGGILGLNIGKNATTPIERAADDYVAALEAVYPHADYVAVNISSPNTKDLRSLQGKRELVALLSALAEQRRRLEERHGRRVPLAVKIAPDLDDAAIPPLADVLVEHGVDGVIATNTTIRRDEVQGLPHAEESGGLSGRPLRERATEVVHRLASHLQGKLPIIGVGGIMTGADAVEKLQAGAVLVQIYTGFIYTGPDLIADCIEAIRAAQPAARKLIARAERTRGLMRCFIAAWPDDATRQRLQQLIDALVPRVPKARPMQPRNLHLTLAFIGTLDDAAAARVASASGDLLEDAFEWSIDALGWFARARVAWAGGASNAQLDSCGGPRTRAARPARRPLRPQDVCAARDLVSRRAPFRLQRATLAAARLAHRDRRALRRRARRGRTDLSQGGACAR